MRTKLCSIGLAAHLFLSSVLCASAVPGTPQNSAEIEKLRREIGKLDIGDSLTVKFHDKSESRTCLKSVETDGFVIGYSNSGAGRTVLYADVDSVERLRIHDLRNRVLHLGMVAGLMTGLVKVGSNTPKTVAAKVPVGLLILFATLAGKKPVMKDARCK